MTSVCLIIALLFSKQGETMQCAVWKDEHEQTETAILVVGLKKRKLVFKTTKNKKYIYIYFF